MTVLGYHVGIPRVVPFPVIIANASLSYGPFSSVDKSTVKVLSVRVSLSIVSCYRRAPLKLPPETAQHNERACRMRVCINSREIVGMLSKLEESMLSPSVRVAPTILGCGHVLNA